MIKFRLYIFGFAAWINYVGFFMAYQDGGSWVLSLVFALIMSWFFSKAWNEHQAQRDHSVES